MWRMRWQIKETCLLAMMALLWLPMSISQAQEERNAEASATGSQVFALDDTKDLVLQDLKAEGVEYKGRKAVHLTTQDAAEYGFAFIDGTRFQDGTIEVDIATKVNAPPGVRMPGFVGIAFRALP
jgi:hypothetical protein